MTTNALKTLINNTKIVEEIIANNCNYCAEPHQLNEDDLVAATDYDTIISEIEDKLNIKFTTISEIGKVTDFISDTLYEWFINNPT